MYKKIIVQDLGPDRRTPATIHKEVLALPTDTQVGGGGNRKIDWGIILSPKLTILQRVGHRTSYLGACYANNSIKGQYGARACA